MNWGPLSGPRAAWLTDRPLGAFVLPLLLAAAIAAADWASGYQLQLAILYLAPIALATWRSGLRAGLPMVALASLLWALAFSAAPAATGGLIANGVVMLTAYLACALLLIRLRAILTRSDQRFLSVLEELHAAVYVADQDSDRVLYANHGLARLLDDDPYALGGRALDQRFGLDPASAGRAASPPTGSGQFVTHELRESTSGRWYRVQVGPIPWKSARRVNVQVITEITEQKQAQAIKRQHQEILHQSSRLATLAEIASSLAHELNQPLMAIASYNDACLRMVKASRFDKNDLIAALQRCREQALRAGKIIGRVRDFIRSRRTSPSPCDVNALVGESIELLETQLDDGGVSVELSLSKTLAPTHADHTLLVQVIVNLVTNAIDAMAKSEPSRRRLSLTTTQATSGEIIVAVADQGPGLAEDVGDQLYTPLFTTKSQGLGLGLAICRSVVEAHGGRIWHEANGDGGCTFYFTLPAESD